MANLNIQVKIQNSENPTPAQLAAWDRAWIKIFALVEKRKEAGAKNG